MAEKKLKAVAVQDHPDRAVAVSRVLVQVELVLIDHEGNGNTIMTQPVSIPAKEWGDRSLPVPDAQADGTVAVHWHSSKELAERALEQLNAGV